MSTILDLWVKYKLNNRKDSINELIDPKSPRNNKLHNYLAKFWPNIYLVTLTTSSERYKHDGGVYSFMASEIKKAVFLQTNLLISSSLLLLKKSMFCIIHIIFLMHWYDVPLFAG